MILFAPLLVFAMIALGVRGRRATANLALLAPLAALAGVVLAGWAGIAKPGFYDGRYDWLNVGTNFSGPAQFQTYALTIGIRVSHLTTVLMLCVLAVSFGLLAWSRVGARGEPSPARYHGLLTLLVACALGVIVSTDLSELYVFWAIGGVATYLLMTNSWSDAGATRAARLSLAVPMVADLSLLAGIAILYSRYGQLSIDQLIPALHHTAGAGPKALATACILIFVGAAGRLGLVPFQGWLTGAATVPTGALAAAQGYWALMAAGLLFKVMPIFASANAWPLRVVAATAAVSAVLLPLLGLAGLDVRRVVTAGGIAISALAVLGFARPLAVATAAVLLGVTGLARVAAVLATGSLVAGMRSPLLTEMGEGFRRMRLPIVTLALAALAPAVAVGPLAGTTLRWYWTLAYALGLALATFALFRVYFVGGHAALPRRRGFDPSRVRTPAALLVYPPLLLALAAFVPALALYRTGFLHYLDRQTHPQAAAVFMFGWMGAVAVGVALAAAVSLGARGLGDRLAGASAGALARTREGSRAILGRRLALPALDLLRSGEESGVRVGELRLGRAIVESGGAVLGRRLRMGPLLIGAIVLAVVISALAAPGVFR